MNDKNTLVLYHGTKNEKGEDIGCQDGYCARFVLEMWGGLKDAEFVPGGYHLPPPDVQGRDVIIVDLSYPRVTLLDMKQRARSLVVLDHHKSAADELKDLDFCFFDMDHSGAWLAWQYATWIRDIKSGVLLSFGDEPSSIGSAAESFVEWMKRVVYETGYMPEEYGHPSPLLVRVVQDRDLWRWKLPNSREVNAAIRSFPMTFQSWWENLTQTNDPTPDGDSYLMARLAEQGTAILRAQQKLVEQIAQGARPVTLRGSGTGVCLCHHKISEHEMQDKYRGTKSLQTLKCTVAGCICGCPGDPFKPREVFARLSGLAVRTSVLRDEVCEHLYLKHDIDFAACIRRVEDVAAEGQPKTAFERYLEETDDLEALKFCICGHRNGGHQLFLDAKVKCMVENCGCTEYAEAYQFVGREVIPQYEASLRSKPERLDISLLAKRYGGGGHPHSTGFTFRADTQDPELRALMEV